MASPDPDYERFVARDYRGPCPLHCSPTSLQRVDTAFRTSTRRRHPQLTYFGAQSHSLHTRCLRFTTWVTPMLRKTRFRPMASLYRAGLATRWVPLQGFSNASSLLPPCPSFPGARGVCNVQLCHLTCTCQLTGTIRFLGWVRTAHKNKAFKMGVHRNRYPLAVWLYLSPGRYFGIRGPGLLHTRYLPSAKGGAALQMVS
jgi:hypothetical protein